VYTRKGDTGETSLVGGNKISKDHIRVEAYGTVDELNSFVGVVRSFNSQLSPSERRDKLELILNTIQQRLFDLGSILATEPGNTTYSKEFSEENVKWLEDVIDAMNEELEPLNSFILPGGSPLNASLHVSRTVCRRAERVVTSLSKEEPVPVQVMAFLNRLSDALFVFSRWVVCTMDEKEYLWIPGDTEFPDWRWHS
jgi:cob(I)alamin adenosyltransferase